MTDRHALLLDRAGEYADVTLANGRREYPRFFLMSLPGPMQLPARPKDLSPAFYGCYDWHSAVEMHWLLVRLLRLLPDAVPADQIRAVLDEHLTAEAIATEAAHIGEYGGGSRPYGWGWALTLTHELAAWDDPDARRWAAHMRPLADRFTNGFLSWLPKATYPVRQGSHGNSAFALHRTLGYARSLEDTALLDMITATALRWFGSDADYPGGWEPDGADFLSPALCEAVLMADLLPPAEFVPWLDRFLPALADERPASLFTPAVVSDDTDGQIAHLHGLNLSRAWCWRRLAEALPAHDPRIPPMHAAAERHAEPELDKAGGTDYMVEHWLACYAVLYLTLGLPLCGPCMLACESATWNGPSRSTPPPTPGRAEPGRTQIETQRSPVNELRGPACRVRWML
jgi:hypothetical protein